MKSFFWLTFFSIHYFCTSYKSCFRLQQLSMTIQYDRNNLFTRASSSDSCNLRKISNGLNQNVRYNYALHVSTRSDGSENRKKISVPQSIQPKLAKTILFRAQQFIFRYLLPKVKPLVLDFSVFLREILFRTIQTILIIPQISILRYILPKVNPLVLIFSIFLQKFDAHIVHEKGLSPKAEISLFPKAYFLPLEYKVKGDSSKKFKICQVPGDGGCLFHSLAVCIRFLEDKHRPPSFDAEERELSNNLRKKSVEILRSPDIRLFMGEGHEILSSELLKMTADNYNTSGDKYLREMLIPTTWGGGPEIVALSNHFKTPIHVYELYSDFFNRRKFQLKILEKFDSPFYDSKPPLQILCADGRFPYVKPGKQKEIGDHFLALYPCSKE